MDSPSQPPADLSLGELAEAVGGAGSNDGDKQESGQEGRRKRRHHRHRRRSRSSGEPRWNISQTAKAWIVIVTFSVSLIGGASWVYLLLRENDSLRSRLSQESFNNRERVAQLEARLQATKLKEANVTGLEHEKFNSIEPLKPTHVKKPSDGALVLQLRLPPLQTDRWDLILRDRVQNIKARLSVSNPLDRMLTVAISDIENNVYEIHVRARGDDTTYRYMFSMY